MKMPQREARGNPWEVVPGDAFDSSPYYCQRFWSLQPDQVRRILCSEGEVRFYYSGFAQAVLLDRLLPE